VGHGSWIGTLVGLLASWGCGTWRESKKAATYGCVASLQAGLSGQHLEAVPSRLGADWIMLPEAERQGVFSRIAEERGIDCGAWDGSEPLLDNWKRPIRLAARRGPSGIEGRVSSAGPDGIDATDDDIMIAQSQRVPQS
jgi:hypothetical protein